MTAEEILKEVDDLIKDKSITEALEVLEEIADGIDARIAGLECDLNESEDLEDYE